MVNKIVNKIKGIVGKNPNKAFDPMFLETLTYKTPFFLFSEKKIINNFNQFKKLFPNSSIYYAMKANSEPVILKILSDAGSGFEVASSSELDMLKKIKVPAEKIIYGTSVKSTIHIKECFKYGVKRYACDSLPELEKIAACAPGSKVYIRSVTNDSGSVFKFSSKFGAETASIIPLLQRAKELGLYPYGISFHVGSQASDSEAWANTLVSLRSIIQDLIDMGIKLDVLNLGGGYPCRYLSSANAPTLKEIAKLTLKQYKKLPYEPKLILEPGRGIIADTGIMVASVIARVERRGSTWLFLDGGCYNGLFEAMAYQGSTRYLITSMRPVKNSGESSFAIAGPTGDSPDVITREVLLPSDIDVGDKLVIHDTGAYSIGMTSRFNGFPKPNVYYI